MSIDLHSIVWIVIVALVVIWLLGLVFRFAKSFIHILLLVAVLLVAYNFIFR